MRKFSIIKHVAKSFLFIISIALCFCQTIPRTSDSTSKELTTIQNKNDYIYLNTIDGQFYAVDKIDGNIKWSLKEEAVLKFPKNYENPYFLTDPRDGSLYIFTNKNSGLKKFPYTIAELVSASPSKSMDGYLYTGDKRDQWLAIDYRNGMKLDTLTSDTFASKIPTSDENILLIGRTQYTISMFDINTRKKIFNLTYYDYSTHAHTSKIAVDKPSPQAPNFNTKPPSYTERNEYPYYHFSSSSDGTLVTLDKRTGELKWQLKLDNPIIAMYRYENEQLFKINFAIFAVEALSNLDPNRFLLLFKEQLNQEKDAVNFSQFDQSGGSHKPGTTSTPPFKLPSSKLFTTTLYIGFYKNNYYAMPALVYNWQLPAIEGEPVNVPYLPQKNDTETFEPSTAVEQKTTTNALAVGHHKLPEKFDPPPNYIQSNNKLIVISNKDDETFAASLPEIFGGFKQPLCPVDNKQVSKMTKAKSKIKSAWKWFDDLMQNKYFWTIFTVLLGSLLPMAKTFYDERKKKRLRELKKKIQQSNSLSDISSSSLSGSDEEDETETKNNGQKSSNSRHSSKSSLSKKSNYTVYSHHSQSAPDLHADSIVRIGKISYDQTQKIGHGCAGTIVYKGTFENRHVAVKRLLPECYILADREVELLQHADQHPNVLRYFCTESDFQFRYIALELCQMTLNEYVHNHYNLKEPPKDELRILSILEQATKGLDHLHALDIVHRDIKPHNVLISFPDQKGRVFVMISDFGLCKRLEVGINSFSKKSGVIGTEGWMAPELIEDLNESYQEQFEDNQTENKRKRITKAVDVFSLGCVYYFVLSGGSHPFGDSIRRQSNIVSNQFKLDKLSNPYNSETYMQRVLIEKMISKEPSQRPKTREVLANPVFWIKAKMLQFLQDVSDRIEKLDPSDQILLNLEKNASVILKNNWKTHICAELQNDLRKFRQYNGVYLRDLLRAIRNKKHHYRELPPEVMKSLGTLPDEFVLYFTSRFPKLILHVYDAMQCCSQEPMLDVYYNYKDHHF